MPDQSILESNIIKPTTTNGSLTLQGDSSGAGVTGITIDSSGNVLAGKTSADSGATAGLEFDASIDKLYVTRSSGSTISFNRLSTDGEIVGFAKDGTAVGSIGTIGDDITVGNGTASLWFNASSSNLLPFNTSTQSTSDNTTDLGASSIRFDDIFATNGTIQTSDEREKQDIDVLSDAEHNVAVAAKGLIRKYRWKHAVAEKGDDARIHFGVIAQDLKAAFEAEGLDAGRYGMFIHSEWWETEETYTDDDGAEKTRINTFGNEEEAPEGAVKKDRMGVRYSELLAFIIAAI